MNSTHRFRIWKPREFDIHITAVFSDVENEKMFEQIRFTGFVNIFVYFFRIPTEDLSTWFDMLHRGDGKEVVGCVQGSVDQRRQGSGLITHKDVQQQG